MEDKIKFDPTNENEFVGCGVTDIELFNIKLNKFYEELSTLKQGKNAITQLAEIANGIFNKNEILLLFAKSTYDILVQSIVKDKNEKTKKNEKLN